MTMSDDTLRRRFERLHPPPELGPCPEQQSMIEAAAGRSSASERAAIADHVVGCAACAAELRVLRALHRDAREAVDGARGAPSPAPAARRFLRRLAWVGAAAAAAAAIAIAVARRAAERPQESILRAEAGEAIRSVLPPDASAPRDQVVLRWAGPRGARYDVTVVRQDLTPVASARAIHDASYRVEPSLLAGLAPGEPILWSVVAVLPDGRRLHSTTFVTRIR
jgi:hypothetical protein